jgi:hypothetical protein
MFQRRQVDVVDQVIMRLCDANRAGSLALVRQRGVKAVGEFMQLNEKQRKKKEERENTP